MQDDLFLLALENFDLDPYIAEAVMQKHVIEQFDQLVFERLRLVID